MDHANFGPVSPLNYQRTGDRTLLLDSLQVAQQGYMLRSTATELIWLYIVANGLQNLNNGTVGYDTNFTHCFGDLIPAVYYAYRDANGRTERMIMTDALAQGLITAPMNTYQVLRNIHPELDIDAISPFYFHSIVSFNVQSAKQLEGQPEFAPVIAALGDAAVRQAMLQDYHIVKQALAEWKEIFKPTYETARTKKRQTRRE